MKSIKLGNAKVRWGKLVTWDVVGIELLWDLKYEHDLAGTFDIYERRLGIGVRLHKTPAYLKGGARFTSDDAIDSSPWTGRDFHQSFRFNRKLIYWRQ